MEKDALEKLEIEIYDFASEYFSEEEHCRIHNQNCLSRAMIHCAKAEMRAFLDLKKYLTRKKV